FCSTMEIVRAGVSLPQTPGFQCLCECPNPGGARVQQFHRLEPGESMEGPWVAHELELCKQSDDCGANGWPGMGQQDKWVSASRAAAPGPLTARIAFETTLPADCVPSNDQAECEVRGGWSAAMANSVVAPFCSASQAAEVEFVLPSSGDLTVEVAVP